MILLSIEFRQFGGDTKYENGMKTTEATIPHHTPNLGLNTTRKRYIIFDYIIIFFDFSVIVISFIMRHIVVLI